jgi:hypothetical protein
MADSEPNPYESPIEAAEWVEAQIGSPDHGELPPWRAGDLPEPLPFSFVNALKTIGPGAILLAAAIGGGEWIIGPLMAVTYGPTILWIATTGIIIQSLFNLEAVRYTLYTGEPIITGIMRLRPGPKFWAPFYLIIGAAQLATPALAVGCATVLITAWTGDKPDLRPAEPPPDYTWATGPVAMVVIVVTVILLQSGKSIERVLERASWLMVAFIFTFLIIMNVRFVPLDQWKTTLLGFAIPHTLPQGVDIILLATFAATAGSGGLGNLTISNWFRDKGFGMGRYMGSIGSALREGHEDLASIGCVFPTTPRNLDRWQSWWRYAIADQTVLWAVGCFLGMFLNVNLVLFIVKPGEGVDDKTLGAFQAHFLAQFWQPLWWLALINGFWILYSTHLGNTDCLVRTSCDILWSASPAVRKWSASKLYAVLLLVLTVWALFAANLGGVRALFSVLGIVANPIMAIAALQILRVNTRFLPKEIRPPRWRQAALVVCALFYGGLTLALLWSMVAPSKG